MWPLKQHLGELCIGLGVAHLAWGSVEYRHTVRDMIRNGWFHTVVGEHKAEREACLWFMISGVAEVSQGILIRHAQRQGLTIPRTIGLLEAAVMLAVGTSTPKFGAPAGLVVAALLLTGGEPKHRPSLTP